MDTRDNNNPTQEKGTWENTQQSQPHIITIKKQMHKQELMERPTHTHTFQNIIDYITLK